MTASRYRGPLAAWALVIAYASLYPFGPLRAPTAEMLQAALTRPRYLIPFDVVVNVAAYAPLGALAWLWLAPGRAAFLRAVGLAALASVAMEASQLFIPGRVTSIYDLAANIAGAALGALPFVPPLDALGAAPLGRWRERIVIPGPWGDTGLMLAALWIVAQLNPALPFFGAGNLPAPETGPLAGGALEAAGAALGVCGFGLFLSVLLVGGQGTLRVTLGVLSVALWLKFLGASAILQPAFSREWATPERFVGIACGLVALAPARRLSRPARTYIAMLAILAGALFSEIAGAYSPLEELLRAFRWPYGQLANLATLTRFLHETWPFATLVFLVALFLRERGDARAIIVE
jgi:VanZ family protein